MSNIFNASILFLIGILVFILPIPHTISIRYGVFTVLFLLIFYKVFKEKLYKSTLLTSFASKYFFIILFVFTLWVFFVSFFISQETLGNLKEVKSGWIMPLLYLITFLFIGIFAIKQKPLFEKQIYYTIFIMLLIHILYVDLYAFLYYIDHKVILLRFAGLTEGSDKANYLTNLVLAYLMSEIIYRIKTSKKMLAINNVTLSFLLILTLLSSLIEAMRNGVIAILFLGLTSVFFSLKGNHRFSFKTKIFITCTLLLFLSLPTFYNLTYDKRWNSLIETIPIALDTQNNKAWINRDIYPFPKLPNGERASGSNYERIAWGYEGLKLILEHPLGIGYGRNAFKHGIVEKYHTQETTVAHSHSGIIDLGIGVGIPAIILWISFGFFLMYLSYSYFVHYTSFYALILFFNVTGFYSRFLVDSNMRDHIFATFMMICGIAFILMLQDKHTYQHQK